MPGIAGTAYAADPQGKLTGAGSVATTLGIERIDVAGPIRDGETVFVNVRNDRSGDCDGDTGSINVKYSGVNGVTKYDVLCAHYVGSSMRVSYFDERLDTYVVFRIKDNGSPGRKDTFAYGTTDTAADATSWVNLGTDTSGHDLTPLLTAQVSNGNYNVTA